jgi:uncharacterized membrane protein YfcA
MLEPWQWALAGLAAFLVGLSKTGVPGLGILSVVLFANALPPLESVGIALVVLIAGDVVAVSSYRREANWPLVFKLMPWAIIGILIGVATIYYFKDANFKVIIGWLILGLVLLHVYRRRSAKGNTPDHLPLWASRMIGVGAGFTTMVANAAGPLMTIYLLSQRLDKRAFIGTTAWYFFILNLFKVPWSIWLEMIVPSSVTILLPLICCSVMGALVGRWVLMRINQSLFEYIALILAVIAGLRLIFG